METTEEEIPNTIGKRGIAGGKKLRNKAPFESGFLAYSLADGVTDHRGRSGHPFATTKATRITFAGISTRNNQVRGAKL